MIRVCGKILLRRGKGEDWCLYACNHRTPFMGNIRCKGCLLLADGDSGHLNFYDEVLSFKKGEWIFLGGESEIS